MVEHILDGSGCRARDILAKDRLPLQRRAGLECGVQLRDDFRLMRGALAHRVVALVSR